MQKRGQVSIFVVIGLVILIVLALLFFLKSKGVESESKIINQEKRMEIEINSIQKEIQECISRESPKIINEFVDSAGFPNPSKTITYHAKPITVLCQNIPEKENCLQTPLLKTDLEKRINDVIEPRIKTCIDLTPFMNKDYLLSLGDFKSTTKITNKLIIISIEYPVTIEKENIKITKNKFDTKINYPLNDLIEGVNKILETEARTGKVDLVSFSLLHVNKYLLSIKKPYPHKIYELSLTRNPKIKMTFAVEGESRF